MAHKAPGKHYREGLSLVELTRLFPDDAAAERWFVAQRWPDGVSCPLCGGTDRVKERKNRKPSPYHCGDCRQYFSVKTGSLMHKLPTGLPDLGHRHLPFDDKPQGRFEHEAASRSQSHTEDRVVSGSPDS